MEEKKILRGELLKNTFSTFISFTILVLIFNVVIYKRVEIMLYESIDEELKNITDSDGSFVVNPRTIYIIRDIEGHIINQNSLGRLYDDYLDLVEFDSKKLNTIYKLKVNNQYNYRGLTTLGYNVKTNEKVYLQLLTNVDGEILTLQNLKARLFGTSLIIMTSSILIGYFLARKTLKSVIVKYK